MFCLNVLKHFRKNVSILAWFLARGVRRALLGHRVLLARLWYLHALLFIIYLVVFGMYVCWLAILF